MRLAIYSRIFKAKDLPYIQELFDSVHETGCEAHVYGPYFEQISNKVKIKCSVTVFENDVELMEQDVDVLITMGGDGTILDTLNLVRGSNLPIMGINLGRMGFLATIEKESIKPAVESFLHGNYQIDRRTLLQLDCNKEIFPNYNFALNDFTILKRDTSAMIIVHAFINGEFLNSYWGDGLIIATPTGSTGYSLSCGGPIIYPNSGNFVITPVAPHNLYVRPFVISDDSVITFEIEGRAEHFLCTLDSRFEQVDSSIKIVLRKADFSISLVRMDHKNFLSTMRQKLFWGSDIRN